MCGGELDMLVHGAFAVFGLLTSYIIYKAVKKREHKNNINKLEVTLDKASKLKDTI